MPSVKAYAVSQYEQRKSQTVSRTKMHGSRRRCFRLQAQVDFIDHQMCRTRWQCSVPAGKGNGGDLLWASRGHLLERLRALRQNVQARNVSNVITPFDGCGHVAFADFNRARQIRVRRQCRTMAANKCSPCMSRDAFDNGAVNNSSVRPSKKISTASCRPRKCPPLTSAAHPNRAWISAPPRACFQRRRFCVRSKLRFRRGSA